MIPVELKDSKSDNRATITERGQVVVAPIDFSVPIEISLILDNVPVNIIEPQVNRQFIITEIIASADRNVGVNGSILEIYETDAIDSSTPTRDIVTLEIAKSAIVPITGLNWITNPAVWINAVMDDNNVTLTLSGYFVKTVSS